MIVLIDNGHGRDTAGKRSPDGRLSEWEWTRQIARALCSRLQRRGIDARLLVPEDEDVPLRQRAARANAVAGPAILVSIHANAAGMGRWMSASGWCAFVAPAAGLEARRLACLLASEAESAGLFVRRQECDRDYWEHPWAICRLTRCPAVLTENCFMDNHADCQWMLSTKGKETIISLHETAILHYLGLHPGAGGQSVGSPGAGD
ncbi:MAG: N-acetylmuramoyl-L-alanine amidase [Muribaculaceae bacterium]|nr:N-acetylmuramoyl-L-alanine amidase [Muribaculaceae bacterium]